MIHDNYTTGTQSISHLYFNCSVCLGDGYIKIIDNVYHIIHTCSGRSTEFTPIPKLVDFKNDKKNKNENKRKQKDRKQQYKDWRKDLRNKPLWYGQ